MYVNLRAQLYIFGVLPETVAVHSGGTAGSMSSPQDWLLLLTPGLSAGGSGSWCVTGMHHSGAALAAKNPETFRFHPRHQAPFLSIRQSKVSGSTEHINSTC